MRHVPLNPTLQLPMHCMQTELNAAAAGRSRALGLIGVPVCAHVCVLHIANQVLQRYLSGTHASHDWHALSCFYPNTTCRGCEWHGVARQLKQFRRKPKSVSAA